MTRLAPLRDLIDGLDDRRRLVLHLRGGTGTLQRSRRFEHCGRHFAERAGKPVHGPDEAAPKEELDVLRLSSSRDFGAEEKRTDFFLPAMASSSSSDLLEAFYNALGQPMLRCTRGDDIFRLLSGVILPAARRSATTRDNADGASCVGGKRPHSVGTWTSDGGKRARSCDPTRDRE